jgi:hypothetical protein
MSVIVTHSLLEGVSDVCHRLVYQRCMAAVLQQKCMLACMYWVVPCYEAAVGMTDL